MQLDAAGATHVGRVRSVNEDAYLARSDVVVVADGMGGHACGDIASALVVAAFDDLGGLLTAARVLAVLERANRSILDEAAAHPERSGMGTTVSGLAVVEEGGAPHWLVFNVGDSRVYRVQGPALAQLTVDHSEVAELVAAGMLTPADARTHPLRNVITRSLGTSPPPTADTWLMPADPGDLFLVCSDGLTNELADAEIADIVAAAPDLATAAADLIAAAVAAGGRDNVTAVLVSLQPRPAATDDAQATTLPRAELHRWAT